MEVSFEILTVLTTAILFSIAYIVSEDFKQKMLFGALTFLCWFGLAIGFMGTNPTYPGYSILFFGVGLFFVFALLYDALSLLRGRNKKEKY